MQESIIKLIQMPWVKLIVLLFAYSLIRNILLALLFVYGYRFKVVAKLKFGAIQSLRHDLKKELPTIIKVFFLDALLFSLFLKAGHFPLNESHWIHDLLTFLALFIWFEIWFYCLHRLLHHPKLFSIHRTHHETRIPTPFSAFAFSPTERFMLFLGTTLLIVILGKQPWFTMYGIIAYFNFNILFSIIGHSDLDLFPQWLKKNPMGKYITPPPEHSIHHSKVKTNYGLFINVLDRVFKTYTPVK